MRYPLLAAVTEDVEGDAVLWPGGDGELTVGGTFDGATVSLEYEYPAGTWQAVAAETTVTEAAIVAFSLARRRVRGVVTGAGDSELSAELRDKMR